MTERKVFFHGELQLMRWSESSTNGASLTFWVAPEDLEAFKLMKVRAGKTAGQRLAVVMMEIGDDEAVGGLPVAETPAPRGFTAPAVGPLGMLAVRWCKSAAFRAWAEHEWGIADELSEDGAKQMILQACGVTKKYGKEASRKHLDADHACGALFHELIRIPFNHHLQENGIEL